MSNSFINLNAGDPDVEALMRVIEADPETVRKGGVWTHYGDGPFITGNVMLFCM